ncbi:hypothetical protein Tco_0561849 [Tanacetum coccineum]
MPTEMELTLEQTQQGVSYEVSNIRVISFIMKMEILLESTSNKLMEILLKLYLPNTGRVLNSNQRKLKDGGEEYILPSTLSQVCTPNSSIVAETEVKNMRLTIVDIYLKHISLARQMSLHRDTDTKEKSELKQLKRVNFTIEASIIEITATKACYYMTCAACPQESNK